MSEPADKYATRHATVCYEAAYPVALDEPTQAQLDHLYWMTDTPVRAIAERLDLTGRSVSSLVTPLPAGFRCHRCRTEHHYTSRSSRAEASAERRWPRPVTRATCGARRRSPSVAVRAGGLPTERSVDRSQLRDCSAHQPTTEPRRSMVRRRLRPRSQTAGRSR
jgi:hypothetical protein